MNRRIWIALSLLAGLAALSLFDRAVHAPTLTEDSYQYIDAAQSVASGECFCTHVAHFDEQIASGRMPVPFTHFAPAYPLLMAALSWTRISMPAAGLLLSSASYLLTLWLIWEIGYTLGAKTWALAAIGLLWIANSLALTDASRVGTEALFTAAIMAIAAVMARDIRNGGSRPALLALVGCLAGAAYDIRYAGLFLLPVVAAYILWRWRLTPASRWGALGGIFAAAALTGAVMIRNLAYTGSWRGGNNSVERRSVRLVLVETFKSYYHLVFGDAVAARFDIWTAIFLIALAATIYLMFRAWRKGAYRALAEFAPLAYAWLALLFVAYAAGVTLTVIVTIAADLPRYNRPIYPLALALVAPLLSAALTGRRAIAGIAAIVAILAIHSRSLRAEPAPELNVLADEMLNRELQPGISARAWLLGHVPPNGVLVATCGQAVAYVLHRDVVSVLEPPYTARPIDGAGYRALMTHEHARYLLLFPGLPPAAVAEQYDIPFLRDLASGASAAPPWLEIAARNSAVAIYECAACVK